MVHWKTLLVAVVPVVGILVGELNHLGRTSFEHLPADLRPFRPYMIQTLNGLGKVGPKVHCACRGCRGCRGRRVSNPSHLCTRCSLATGMLK